MFSIIFIAFISIHASAREATFSPNGGRGVGGDFNPRLREGGDSVLSVSIEHKYYFNPRLREGGDHL